MIFLSKPFVALLGAKSLETDDKNLLFLDVLISHESC
jgi:hypothetical protein